METEPGDSIQSAEDRKVPEELLQKLHLATQEFHAVKQELENVTADAEFSHQQRLDQLQEKLRKAEREVEQVSMQIHGTLKTPPIEPNH
jgi:polyhydroxyalkanoate synthesis regulator phasin